MNKTGILKTLIAGLACVALVLPAAVAQQINVGFREVGGANAVFGVWYPTADAPQDMRLGPFDVIYAKNATPAKPGGVALPVVLLSHGGGGYYRNHHLTAAHLVRNGYVVIAPQHGDIQPLFADIPKRANDLKNAVAVVQAQPGFANVLDAENINAIGYSRGGMAVLAAAGANINLAQFRVHCAKNYGDDSNACGGFPLWARLVWRVKDIRGKVIPDVLDFSDNPAPFRKIALIAPVGHAVDADSLANVRAKTLIVQIKDDTELRAPYHAEFLRDNLPPDNTKFLRLSGHHFAFVAPFPKWLTDEEDIPGAEDPPGFNRANFIADVNTAILFFLRQ